MTEDESFSDWEQIPSPTSQSHPLSPTHQSTIQEPPFPKNSNFSPKSSVSSFNDDIEEVSEFNSQLGLGSEIGRRIDTLCSGVVRIVARIRRSARCKVAACPIGPVSGVVMALLASLLYVRFRRWLKRIQENERQLLLLIQEKDKKVKKLLLELAKMNELISRPRTVPVLRIS